MADVETQLTTRRRGQDQEFLEINKRLKRLKRGHAGLDRRLTVTSTGLDQELANINKRLKSLEGRVGQATSPI